MQAGFERLLGGVCIIAAAVSICSADAEATPIPVLPAAQYYNAAGVTLPNGTEQFDGGSNATSASVVGSAPFYPTSWNFGTSNNYNTPSVSASAQAGNGIKGGVSSYLTYYVQFSGAAGDIQVNVQASGGASAAGENILNGYGRNVASAWFDIEPYYSNGGTGSELAFASVGSNERNFSGPGLHTFSFDQDITFTANMVYQVMMETTAEAWDGQTATAYVDPFFTAPAGYSVLTSSGIGNVAATPIPAALPLFASALGGLGLLGWRRKGKAAALAA
jgi:hypothetical protein